MLIDLRSDTVTRPTEGMLKAMQHAEVGDDVFGDDPTVKELEKRCAELLGMDAGVFCPSGTMTNQIGVNLHTRPYDEIICWSGSHVYRYEGGGIAGNSGANVKLLEGNNGILLTDEIELNINDDSNPHNARTALVSIESTLNRGGGSYYTLGDIKPIHAVCKKRGIRFHLDGARLFNALVETGESPSEYGQYFDSISICLSKGLGAPVGSVLVMKKEFENQARRRRKTLGGGMRQAGYLAAAGLYALENNINRLKKDHEHARAIESTLIELKWVKSIVPVKTNIVIFQCTPKPEEVLNKLKEKNILAVKFGEQEIRMVTHLDFSSHMLENTISTLKQLTFA
jgi:threonine aldolase